MGVVEGKVVHAVSGSWQWYYPPFSNATVTRREKEEEGGEEEDERNMILSLSSYTLPLPLEVRFPIVKPHTNINTMSL